MRRFFRYALGGGALAAALLLMGGSPAAQPASAAIVFNAHVHDDYFHPTGSFVPGPGHAVAQALCMNATPDPSCTASVQEGDSVQWLAPAPLAVNAHSVTECTDGTWTVCGPAVSAGNPIDDSGVRFQPGWPYVVQFNAPGTYYYRCEVHPAVMRGVVFVASTAVGGTVEQPAGDNVAAASAGNDDGASTWPYIVALGGALALSVAGLAAVLRRRATGGGADAAT